MWCSLLDVCHIYGRIGFRGYTKEDLVFSGGAITLSPSNIINGKMSYDNCTYISWAKYEESPEIKVSNNDIVLVKTGSSYGKCALVTELPQAATINPQFVVLKYISCNSELLRYILQSDYAKYNYKKFVLGTAIPTFTQVALGNMLIPLPPLKEQIKIIKEIEKWFAIIDEVENNTIALETYIKQIKSKILDLAISGKLVSQDPTDEPAINLLKRINPNFKPCDNSHYENIPESWQEIAMGNICELSDGEKINDKQMVYLDVKYLRGKTQGETKTNGKFIKKDTTLILVDGENSGEIFVTPIDGCQGSTFKILNISDKLYKEYILLLIRKNQKMLRENKVGSAIPHLNKKIFKELIVPIPPLNEQRRIVNAIETIFSHLDTITAEL